MQDLIVTPWPFAVPIALLATAWAWHVRTHHRATALGGAASLLSAPARPARPCGDHWLQRWLADVGGHAPLQAEHVREFHQRPDVVFAAMVQVLAAEARIELIEGFGTEVAFSCDRRQAGPGRVLRARVRQCGAYTVLEISSEHAPPASLAERQHECARVHQVLNLLAHRLHGSSRLGRIPSPRGERAPLAASA